MFKTLVESAHVPHPPALIGAVSTVVHAVVVAGAIAAAPREIVPLRGGAIVPLEVTRLVNVSPALPPRGEATATEATPPDAENPPPPRKRDPAMAPLPAVAPAAPLDLTALAEQLGALQVSPAIPDLAEFLERTQRGVVQALADRRGKGGLGAPLPVDMVERVPIAMAGNPRPEYPPMLLRRRVQGYVEIQFVIDTTGRADIHSMQVLNSADAMFTRAVASVLPRMRFLAGELGGKKVNVVVNQLFTFVVQ